MKKIIIDIKRIYSEKPDVIKSIYLFCLFTAVFLFSPLINIVLDKFRGTLREEQAFKALEDSRT